jgi:hypothetical protein
MGGTAPANQLRLSFAGSEDGEAETETCSAAKPLWRTKTRTSGPQGPNSLNRPMRTRLSGGVGGRAGDCSPYPDGERLDPLARMKVPQCSAAKFENLNTNPLSLNALIPCRHLI